MKTKHSSTTGYGFTEILGKADHTRFSDWYARSSLLAHGQRPRKPRSA